MKHLSTMLKTLVTVVLLVSCYPLMAQSFLSECDLDEVPADGFYRIDVSPELMPELNRGLSNVRIMDVNGKEVPWLLRQEQPSSQSKVFRPYRIVQYDKVKNCCTSIILENPDNNTINNVHLSIRNADVSKAMTLTGSDDKQNWYALKAKSTISATGDGQSTSTIRLLDFPMSNYAYYKIDIDDSTSAPLNITAAGYYEVNTWSGEYSVIPSHWMKADSAATRQTFIKVSFNHPQIVDRITLSMKGAAYFLRKGSVLRPVKSTGPKPKLTYDHITTFTVSSKQSAIVDLHAERGDEFILAIENEDNPALEVDSLRAEQLNRYLVAWLVKGEKYALKFGTQDLQAPRYDLMNFADSIPANPTQVKAGALRKIEQAGRIESPTIFTNKIVIWVAIVLVIGVLGFMVIRMTREM